jgi:hypothetical protein
MSGRHRGRHVRAPSERAPTAVDPVRIQSGVILGAIPIPDAAWGRTSMCRLDIPRLTVKQKSGSPDACRDCRSYSGIACRSVSRIRSARVRGRARAGEETIIYLERPSPTVSSGLPAPMTRRATSCPDTSRRLGAAWPFTPWGLHGRSGRPERRCALTAPFHPLPRTNSGRDCSLLHVPSPRLLPGRLPVRKHGALWCSDFPHRRPSYRRGQIPIKSGRLPGERRGQRSDGPIRTLRNYTVPEEGKVPGSALHRGAMQKSAAASTAVCAFTSRVSLSSRRPFRCKAPGRR